MDAFEQAALVVGLVFIIMITSYILEDVFRDKKGKNNVANPQVGKEE